jgi:hypothetical protein
MDGMNTTEVKMLKMLATDPANGWRSFACDTSVPDGLAPTTIGLFQPQFAEAYQVTFTIGAYLYWQTVIPDKRLCETLNLQYLGLPTGGNAGIHLSGFKLSIFMLIPELHPASCTLSFTTKALGGSDKSPKMEINT